MAKVINCECGFAAEGAEGAEALAASGNSEGFTGPCRMLVGAGTR